MAKKLILYISDDRNDGNILKDNVKSSAEEPFEEQFVPDKPFDHTVVHSDAHYKNKALFDAEYVENASLSFDLKLIFRTVAVVLKKEGIK